jgi:hypothetical protein
MSKLESGMLVRCRVDVVVLLLEDSLARSLERDSWTLVEDLSLAARTH